MPKLTSQKPEDHPYAIPPTKMVVPPKTYSMTIPEFCEQLAFARHPLIEGELRIEEALKVQPTDGPHFSEEGVVDTEQNVALRRASTASVCSAALYNAVHEGKLDFIHPMTGGRLIVTPHIRPEQEIDSSCKSPWQQEADRHQVRLTDLVHFAKVHDIEIVWANLDNPMPRTSTKSGKIAAKHEAWVAKACQILEKRTTPVSPWALAELVRSALRSDPELHGGRSTIYKIVLAHEVQIFGR